MLRSALFMALVLAGTEVLKSLGLLARPEAFLVSAVVALLVIFAIPPNNQRRDRTDLIFGLIAIAGVYGILLKFRPWIETKLGSPFGIAITIALLLVFVALLFLAIVLRRSPSEIANVAMGRFSAQTEDTLRRAGWYPGRQALELVASWKDNEMLSRFEMFPSAERVLREFGGLRVDEHGPGETCARVPFEVDPTLAGYEEELFHHFSTLVNTRLYPLGEVENGHNYWAIGEDDRVYLLMNDIRLLGNNIDQALENLIIGRSATEILPAG